MLTLKMLIHMINFMNCFDYDCKARKLLREIDFRGVFKT